MAKSLAGVGLTLDQIRKEGGIHVQPGKDPYGVNENQVVLFYNQDMADEDYPAIPTYIPVDRPPAGFMRLLYGRTPLHSFSRTLNNAWLIHEAPINPVWVNDKVAARLGLKDGDKVRLVNQDGKESNTTTIVKVTPGIREDAVYMYLGYGLKSKEMTLAVGKGIDDTSMMTKIAVDPETGAHGMRNNFVKIVKVG